MDPNKVLLGLAEEPHANTNLALQFAAMLHGWLAAGGAEPQWHSWPIATARFLNKYGQYKKRIANAQQYVPAARRILAARDDEYTSGKDLQNLEQEISHLLSGR